MYDGDFDDIQEVDSKLIKLATDDARSLRTIII